MTKKYVAKLHDNWADEMDIDTACIVDEEYMNEFNDAVEKHPDLEIGICYGTNEDSYATAREIQDKISFMEITPEEIKVLKKFGLDKMGQYSARPDYIMDNVLDECDNVDDED